MDPEGHFWGSYRELTVDRSPAVPELEIEFRAQIDRALRSGIRIDYVDNHMGAGLATPEQREMVRRVAADYGAGVSGSFGERAVSVLGREDLETSRIRLVTYRSLSGERALARTLAERARVTSPPEEESR